jgi:hypothetical protein
LDQVDERTRRELATTRILYIVWAALGIVVVLVLCYLVFNMLRSREAQSVVIGRAEDFPADSISLKYVNAAFGDPETNKDFATLSLEIVRDPGGGFTVFFARSTDPAFGGLTPRQCVVGWDEALQRFVEPCGGAKWTRDGKYAAGPAPRDLDRFPSQVTNGDLTIRLDLIMGAAHP